MAQQLPNSGQSGNMPIIKSEQIDKIPNIPNEMKVKYKNGLASLEQQLLKYPQGSPDYMAVEQKIRSASATLMGFIGKATRPAGAAQGQGGQQGGGAPSQRPQGGPAQQNGANAGAPAMQQQGSQQGQQMPQMLPNSRAELNNTKINIPQGLATQGEQAINQYRLSFMRKGASLLNRRDNARAKGSNLQKMLQSGQHGNATPEQIQQEMTKLKAEMTQANTEWEQMKQQNIRQGQAGGAQQGAGNQPQPQPQQTQTQQPPQSAAADMSQRPTSSQQAPSQPQADAKMAMDQQQARPAMSPAQPQGGFQQQQQQQQMPPSSQSNMPTQSTQQQQSTPQSATQPQAAQNFPQPNNAGQQQQQPRPQMTAQQIMQAQQNMLTAQQQQHQQQQQQQQQQHAGIPQNPPQPQAPPQAQPPQRPQALSHQAAMSQASSARQDAAQQQQQQHQYAQQQAHQQAQMSSIANGVSLNPPQSATIQTPPSAYAHPQAPQQVSSSTKFPIPKQLNLDPRAQNPVQGPSSRPTFSNAGMMGQPGIQRAGQFTLEGEGDRVLSKRKLDELVRQVTGSTDGAESGGGLTSDVEEAVLTLADDFVDNLITSACRLAKLRSSQTLDIRDIQIVLERNYGIRIPGYGLDEVRTVRKFQPAEGWRNKMQAVQAGKVMGSNAGKDA